jgi:hypothetical protein
MKNINDYKKRFYNLTESTMGDVRPLLMEVYTPPGAIKGRSRDFKDKASFEAFKTVPTVSLSNGPWVRDLTLFPSLVEKTNDSNRPAQWNSWVRKLNPNINIAVTTMNGELSMMAAQIFLVSALVGLRNLITDADRFFSVIYNTPGLQAAFKAAGGDHIDTSRIGIYSGQVRDRYVSKTTFKNYIDIINPIYTERLTSYAMPEAPTKPQASTKP